jgi:putative membrane protein
MATVTSPTKGGCDYRNRRRGRSVALVLVADLVSPPVRLHTLLGGWQTDPLIWVVAAAEVAAVTWYVVSLRRLGSRGRRWPLRRLVSFVVGILVVVVAIQSGLAAYDDTNFTAHVMQHLLLMNLAPPLLAMGAPITLALQSSRRSTTTRLLRVLHSRPARILTHPLVAAGMTVVTMYAYFLTPLYRLSLEHPLLHYYFHVHFLLVGCLFWWPIVGTDVLPRRWSHGAKLGLLFAGIPWSSFLGIALLTTKVPIAPAHTLADTHSGGGLLWAATEIFNVMFLLVVVADWARSDLRQAQRYDRLVDQAAARPAPAGAPVAAAAPAGPEPTGARDPAGARRPVSTWALTREALRRPADPTAGRG